MYITCTYRDISSKFSINLRFCFPNFPSTGSVLPYVWPLFSFVFLSCARCNIASKGRRQIASSGSREYVNGVPVATIRTASASSRDSSRHAAGSINASSHQQSPVPDITTTTSERPVLSPIIDVSMSREASRTFAMLAPVPPIAPKPKGPAVQTLGIYSFLLIHFCIMPYLFVKLLPLHELWSFSY